LLTRYTTSENGKPIKQAEIYTAEEHGIKRRQIDSDALSIARRLGEAGYSAYVVGGAIRDLMVGKEPKDYDLVTDAQPGRIRRLFRNSRVIGKRFRLVHVIFKNRKIIEVSTFRAQEASGFNNVYGAIEEDVLRRDFTINALYYDPNEETLLDYVGAMGDIKAKKLKPVIPLSRIFDEDPVRMIRAIKYSTSTGFRMTSKLRRQLRRSVDNLYDTSPSRMTEELFKIIGSGYAAGMFEEFFKLGMVKYVLPGLAELVAEKAHKGLDRQFLASMRNLDHRIQEKDEERRYVHLAYATADYLFTVSEFGKLDHIPFSEAFADIKLFLRPLVPPNREVERALVYLIRRRKRYFAEGVLDHE
jgi:poly(A) polymerase